MKDEIVYSRDILKGSKKLLNWSLSPYNFFHNTSVKCSCGMGVEVTYVEDRTYILRCRNCQKVMIVIAGGPDEAAEQWATKSEVKQ